MAPTSISLRDRLTGAVVDFLNDEGMSCTKTQDGLVEVVNSLSLYREEGRALFPEVFVLDNLGAALAASPGSEIVHLSSGPREPATMSRALKQCAPLAESGWAVYIHREDNRFTYGMIRSGIHALSVPLSDLLIDKGDTQIPALMVKQVAESVVQLKGVWGSSLLVYFGATRTGNVSLSEARGALVKAIVASVEEQFKEQAYSFYEDLISQTLKRSHGTLAVVQSATKKKLPAALRDGVFFPEPVNPLKSIRKLITQVDCQSNTQLLASSALVKGMLASDGITVFGSDGSVRAFNVFVKHPRQTKQQTYIGGARRRTFETLVSMLGKHLDCVFMQSHDGTVDFKRGNQ